MKIVLEFFRIIVIFLILGGLMGAFVNWMYASFGIDVDNTIGAWLVELSIIIMLFVLYRNRLQFSGYYKGEGKVKLSKKVGNSLIFCSVIMLFLAPLFH